jgi:hypothetical protein
VVSRLEEFTAGVGDKLDRLTGRAAQRTRPAPRGSRAATRSPRPATDSRDWSASDVSVSPDTCACACAGCACACAGGGR